MLKDYWREQEIMNIYCDNTNFFNLSKNCMRLSKIKFTDVRNHFIREFVENNIIVLKPVITLMQRIDILTMAFGVQYEFLRKTLGICVL